MIYAVMLGYNRSDVIRGGFVNFENTVDLNENIKKVFFDPGYPLPNADDNRKQNKSLCEEFGWEYTEISNEGVLNNWNKVIHDHLKMQNGDFLITNDPDMRMRTKGWIPAMVEALNSDPKAMFCASSLSFHEDKWMQDPPYNRKVTTLPSGLKISRFDCLIAWASGMWRADFLITRPRNFGAAGKYYGWNEHADYERLLKHGYTWLAVTDYIDDHLEAPDQEYLDWKMQSAQHKTDKPFDEWLKEANERNKHK